MRLNKVCASEEAHTGHSVGPEDDHSMAYSGKVFAHTYSDTTFKKLPLCSQKMMQMSAYFGRFLAVIAKGLG